MVININILLTNTTLHINSIAFNRNDINNTANVSRL